MSRLAALWLLLSLVAGSPARADHESARESLQRGDEAARSDRHEDAIRAYEDAIELDPALRPALLPKLGRQYLWWDRPGQAERLLAEHLERHPEDCEVQSDWALALSWDDRLREARRSYQELRRCPGLGSRAKLGEARVLRWMDRPAAAARLYEEVVAQGTPGEATQAQLGLALAALQSDRNRTARDGFAALRASGLGGPEAAEGLAVAHLRLGAPKSARAILREAEATGMRDSRLEELAQDLERLTRPTLRSTSTAFRDRDETSYLKLEQAVTIRTGLQTLWETAFSFSRLRNDESRRRIDGRSLSLGVEHRFDESLALRGDLSFTRYRGVGFEPVGGELRAVVTPTDATRVDLSVARITVPDNLDALSHHLEGTFLSAGMDRRLTDHDTVSLGLDWTFWSEGNRRARYRFDLRHRFEGNPRLTLGWPTLVQTYDEGFDFSSFSPERYIESGPAIQIDWRPSRRLRSSLYLRAGFQRESLGSWEPLGTVRASIERELTRHWALSASVGYSTSSLTSSTGFRRLLANLGASYRF